MGEDPKWITFSYWVDKLSYTTTPAPARSFCLDPSVKTWMEEFDAVISEEDSSLVVIELVKFCDSNSLGGAMSQMAG